MPEVERSWFVPGTGIDRHVITTDIQRYLGNDATARPGTGTGSYAGVPGYWIKAYRNLTTAMIADLKADSARWVQEQSATRQPGSNYVGSRAQEASIDRNYGSRARASPSGEYGASSGRDRMSSDRPERMPVSRAPVDRMAVDRMPLDRMPVDRIPMERARPDRIDVDSMDIDPPAPRGYANDRGSYGQDARRLPVDNRSYQDSRSSYAIADPVGYGRAPPSSSGYGAQDSNFGRGGLPQPSNDGAPPGYVRQGDFYIPISSVNQPSSTVRADLPYGGVPYGSTSQLRGGPDPRDARDMRDPRDRDMRDVRDPREIRGNDARDGRGQRDTRNDPRDTRDTRFDSSYDHSDPRYAYPSPAMTVSAPSRDVGQQSPYGASGQSVNYDTGYGSGNARPVASGLLDPRYAGAKMQPPAGYPTGGTGERDARRRRVQ